MLAVCEGVKDRDISTPILLVIVWFIVGFALENRIGESKVEEGISAKDKNRKW